MLELAEARKLTWLKEGSSTIQQQALRDLDRAFWNWWKRPDHFGHPIWRRAGINEGFVIRDLSIRRLNRKWGQAFIPKCGWVKFRVTCEWRDIETALSARVTKDRAGRWFVSFTRLAPQIERESTGEIVGLDMGVTHTVATSKGKFLDIPKLLTNRERQPKRRLQRKLARQTKGSNRRNATKLAISKGDRSTQRLDRVDHDLIALEDLGVKNMIRSAKGTVENPGKNVAQKSGLNRSILEQGWGMFHRRLTDKAINAITPMP